MNPAAAYWNRGVENVPLMTGASALLEAKDIPGLAADLGFSLPFGSVLDVGCGTGRIARHCTTYRGVDIAADAVKFCRQEGRAALLIDGPESLPVVVVDWITCLSVFTHISHDDRVAYLLEFAKRAPNVLVDIIPGTGAGDVEMWTADPVELTAAIVETGWTIRETTDRENAHLDGRLHRYYWLTR